MIVYYFDVYCCKQLIKIKFKGPLQYNCKNYKLLMHYGIFLNSAAFYLFKAQCKVIEVSVLELTQLFSF
jgi:hypothetical protein